MHKSEISFIEKDKIEKNLMRINSSFNKYISDFPEELTNQLLKAKENDIYLFLDKTFSIDDLRFARGILKNGNLESFFANYEEKIIDGKLLMYEYKITTTKKHDYIIVEITNSGLSTWDPSVQFISKIAEMKYEKEHIKFEKIVSPIYKAIYPLDSPESVQKISANEHEYIIEILRTTSHNIRTDLLTAQMRRLKSHDYISAYREYELKELYELTCSCMYKMDFKDSLSEKDILLINTLLKRNKYNIFLNRKFKERE